MYKSTPAWSMKAKYQPAKKDDIPSPAAYNCQNRAKYATPSWKIGRAKRDRDYTSYSPGPGKYVTEEPNYHSMLSTKCKQLGKFGKHLMTKDDQVEHAPGPCEYKPLISTIRSSSPIISFGKQYKSIDKSMEIPGPGAYLCNASIHNNNLKGGAIGKQERFANTEHNFYTPGPGKYQFRPNSAGKNASFTKTTRNCAEITHFGEPGPGQYSSLSLFEAGVLKKKGFSLGLKPPKKGMQEMPGPSSYSPTTANLESSPSVIISKKYHEPFPSENPGPAKYNPYSNEKSISVSISKAKRGDLNCSQVPGPGTYQNQKNRTNKQSPKYSLGQSRKVDWLDDIPGPGAYSPNKNYVKSRPQSAKIGRQKRNATHKQNVPGPGSYNKSERPLTPKYTFGKDSRLRCQNEVTPGPGQYFIPSSVANTAPYALR